MDQACQKVPSTVPETLLKKPNQEVVTFPFRTKFGGAVGVLAELGMPFKVGQQVTVTGLAFHGTFLRIAEWRTPLAIERFDLTAAQQAAVQSEAQRLREERKRRQTVAIIEV